jgi:hypothetical protein
MGILTDNTALNAWIILGLIAASGAALGATGFLGLKTYQFVSGVGIPQTFLKFIYYIPLALLSFGVVADIVSQTFKFSIGSLIGAAAMIVNWCMGALVKYIFSSSSATPALPSVPTLNEAYNAAAAVTSNVATAAESAANAAAEAANNPFGVASPPEPDLGIRGGALEACSFPGLERFDNKWAPQNILVTTAVMFYYMIGEWESGNSQRTVVPGVALLVTVLSQIGVMYSSGCLDPWWSPIVAILGGMASGGIGYGVVKGTNKNLLPFNTDISSTPTSGGLRSVQAPTPTSGFSGVEAPMVAPTDATKPADGSKCAEASGDDFVCDLYKNGELITSTVSG